MEGMSRSTKGKRVALWAAGLAVLVLVALGWVAKDRIREKWLIYQLPRIESHKQWDVAKFLERIGPRGQAVAENFYIALLSDSPRHAKDRAAERLAEMQSISSVPHLLRLALADNGEECSARSPPRSGGPAGQRYRCCAKAADAV